MWSRATGAPRSERTDATALHITDCATLGHSSIETTQMYLEANLALKEEILAKAKPIDAKPGRFKPGDRLLNFLKSL